MADKTKTFFEPTESDIQAVTLVYQDGEIIEINADFNVRSDDPNARYRANPASRRSTKDDYPPGILNALGQLVSNALTKFKQGEGF